MATILKSDNPNARKPWTVRYRDSFGKQHEKSFTHKKLADEFAKEQEYKKQRFGTDVNVSAQKMPFNEGVDRYIESLPAGRTKDNYRSCANKWVKPAYAGKSARDAASDSSIADKLVNVTMSDYHKELRGRARTVITHTLQKLIAEGAIESHRVIIKLADIDRDAEAREFQEISAEDAEHLAEKCGYWVTLQYRLGLRVSEALGLHKSDFVPSIDGKTAVLHLTRQASRDGKTRVPLKAKKASDYRDIPVPADVWEVVKQMPEGALFAGKINAYRGYNGQQERFTKEAEKIGFKRLNTHMLRHAFASNMISKGMNIFVVSKLLGHNSVEVTSRVYAHLLEKDHSEILALMAA